MSMCTLTSIICGSGYQCEVHGCQDCCGFQGFGIRNRI
jgi:hypothetical protein